ncbi:hypothetical protein M9458_018000, partial [Cirrhinus mrigala]
GLPTALETAEHLFQQVFHHFGLPEEIVSDQGPQFISHVWKAFFKLLGISVNLSSGYHPQTNGQTERKIQELGQLEQVPPVGRVRTELSPARYHQLNTFPVRTRLPGSAVPLDGGTLPCSSCRPLVLGERESVGLCSLPSPAGSSTAQEVRQCQEKTRSHLSTWGSGLVVQINDYTFQLQLPPRYRIHPTFHVSLLKPFFPSATDHTGAEAEPPPPEVLDQPSIFTVHEILDSQRRGGHLEYLVDWEGYGPEERSWVPRDDILDPTLLQDVHRSHPDRPAPRGRGRPRRHVRA